MPPAVSIVMPAYNAAATIGAAVAGALWQQEPDFELIVVDDGSTDGTATIVEAIDDPRVRVVRQDNAGCAAARNRGLAVARADLVTLCDADDIMLPGHLSALLEVHDRHGGIVTANAWLLRPDGQITRRRLLHKGRFPVSEDQRLAILQENFVSVMSVFPRELADLLGGFDESQPMSEDWDFWIRAIYAGSWVSQQRRPLALYNRTSATKSSDPVAMEKGAHSILSKTAERDDLRPDERDYLRRRLADESPASHVQRGREALGAGQWDEAAAAYRQAAELNPGDRRLGLQATALRLAPRITGPLLRKRS